MKKIILLFVISSCGSSMSPTLEEQNVGTNALLQAISIVDKNTVWISGHNATFARTINGGESWEVFQHPTEDSLQFRDVHAFDESKVVLMSAGPGSLSRIFTVENRIEWQENFIMRDSLGFLDCIDFWDSERGIAFGDAIDDYPYILLTLDGGTIWNRANTDQMPKAGEGEGGFAASGTCVTTGANGLAWIATGAGGNARILFTGDYGASWESFESPIVKGEAAGHTSIDFVDSSNGFITGGDLTITDAYTDNCAFTSDGGKTWTLTSQPITKGAFYGSSRVHIGDQNFTFVCGPNGLDYSSDLGQTWTQLDSLNYWAINMHKSGIGWASGKDGVIIKIELE
ncbi:MAG: hypothetical protein GY816_06205 [Cytophagales bacterium]|nr:hypothetical protein [Cytophagales bacterium]